MKKRKHLKLVFIITLMVINLTIFGVLGYKYLFDIQPAVAQRVSYSDLWQSVYKQLPNFPKENQYISKETGKVAENNTLIRRLIRYHVYVKGRSPVYRFDWKLTLADYLNANEAIYEDAYPDNDVLRKNPLDGDRAVISHLTRDQRNELIQAIVNVFNTPQSVTTPVPDLPKSP